MWYIQKPDLIRRHMEQHLADIRQRWVSFLHKPMPMKFYRLEIPPVVDDDGQPTIEWYDSLAAATARRTELIEADPEMEFYEYGSGFAVCKFEFSQPLTVLEALNGHMSMKICRIEQVLPAYQAQERGDQ